MLLRSSIGAVALALWIGGSAVGADDASKYDPSRYPDLVRADALDDTRRRQPL
jgi:hypothetical protein